MSIEISTEREWIYRGYYFLFKQTILLSIQQNNSVFSLTKGISVYYQMKFCYFSKTWLDFFLINKNAFFTRKCFVGIPNIFSLNLILLKLFVSPKKVLKLYLYKFILCFIAIGVFLQHVSRLQRMTTRPCCSVVEWPWKVDRKLSCHIYHS